ncbi:peptidoglycan-binding domain-containing protein [Streptomyces sp. NPDC051172]
MQYLLAAHGAHLAADGRFGAGTRDAVITFQRAQGLTPTASWGRTPGSAW